MTIILFLGYNLFFETISKGQTPGKKIFNIRIITIDGRGVGFSEAFTRNFFRIIDFLPLFYIVGACMLFFRRDYRRVGDLLAKTVAVRVYRVSKQDMMEELMYKTQDNENLYKVNVKEYKILREFIKRYPDLSESREVLANRLSKYFINKFGIDETIEDYLAFFNEIIEANSNKYTNN